MATEKITAIVDSIAELSVLELKELKETIEETFGAVSYTHLTLPTTPYV